MMWDSVLRCWLPKQVRRKRAQLRSQSHVLATDAISRLLPLHGRTKLLELIRDIYHRFHVLHCSSGVIWLVFHHALFRVTVGRQTHTGTVLMRLFLVMQSHLSFYLEKHLTRVFQY
jgi:hypothetical protein